MTILIVPPVGSYRKKMRFTGGDFHLFHNFNNMANIISHSHKSIVQCSLSANPAIQGSRFECKSWSHGLWQLGSVCALHCGCAIYNLCCTFEQYLLYSVNMKFALYSMQLKLI